MEQGYVEQATPTDGMRNLYSEMVRSRDYGDKRFYPEVSAIEDEAKYWIKELNAPERSPRAIADIHRLIARQVFEITMRGYE